MHAENFIEIRCYELEIIKNNENRSFSRFSTYNSDKLQEFVDT